MSKMEPLKIGDIVKTGSITRYLLVKHDKASWICLYYNADYADASWFCTKESTKNLNWFRETYSQT